MRSKMSKIKVPVLAENGMLNQPGFHSIAAFAYEFSHYEWKTTNRYESGSFYISDCDNRISLDLDVDSEESLNNSIHKLDTLIKGLQAAKRDLKKAYKFNKKHKKKD